MSTLSPATLAAVRRVWAARLRVDERTFESAGVVLVERDDLDAVVVVALGPTTVAAGPGWALAALGPLDRDALVDVPLLLTALEEHGPEAIGAATLAFADPATGPTTGPAAEAATEDDACRALDACSEADQQESGLREMPARFVVREDGRPVALGGYEVWNGEVAHLGVLVVADARGRGLARAAARAAMSSARGLVPQWRASVANPASAVVAERVGFVRTGLQVAVDVSRSRPGRA